MKKVLAHGIGGKIRAWINNWLTARVQRVKIGGKFSSWREVLSGVPQGSVLGPVLFNIFINDLDSAATDSQLLKKFADDTKVAQVIKSESDAAELQSTLNRLSDWADNWGMDFNVAKCHVMHIGRTNPKHPYQMRGTVLEKTTEERDIGVIVADNLKPAAQCRKAAHTANTVLGQILRAFHYRDRHIFLSLYQQYVRPHLEFAATTWSPWSRGDIEVLEKVQMKAVKAISGLRSAQYGERLEELGLQSLEARRKEQDLLQTFKIVNGIDLVTENMFEMAAEERRPTRQTTGVKNIVTKRSSHEYRKNFFTIRVAEDWNKLPDHVKDVSTVSTFRRQYRQLDTVAPTYR